MEGCKTSGNVIAFACMFAWVPFIYFDIYRRSSMTFIFPANSKNSNSAVCRLYTEMCSFVFAVNVGFFAYFYK